MAQRKAARAERAVMQEPGEARQFQKWLLAFGLVSAAVLCCYLWIDRPVALWMHAFQNEYHSRDFLDPLTHFPDPVISAAAAAYLLIGLAALAIRIRGIGKVAVLCCVSVVMGETIKSGLKWFFGRPWPETWKNNNPSFIGDGAYDFHWLHGGGLYNSFPSGHMTVALALLSVLWIAYPRWRPLYTIAVLGAAVALVGSNYHFVGDVIAGSFLGATVGWITVALFRAETGGNHPH